MKNHKGYPYKEKRKPKSKAAEDKRPHMNKQVSWWKSDEPETSGERAFYVPNIRLSQRLAGRRWNDEYKMDVWTVQEAHTLIDMWAQVCWGRNSEFHHQMSKKARYFRKLWIKQRGKCAITGIELEGAPGRLGRGIGIDVINPKLGIRKQNIRLVSAPIAHTRFLAKDGLRYGTIERLDAGRYEQWPIFWAVLKHFHWYLLKECRSFTNVPVRIKFPCPTFSNQDGNRPDPWVRFEWVCASPHDDSMEAWQNPGNNTTKFADVFFKDEYIHINYLKEIPKRSYRHWNDLDFSVGDYDRSLPLCDPTIDFFKEIVETAEIGFQSLGRWLAEISDRD